MAAAAPLIHIVPPGADPLRVLEERIAELRGRHPLRPVTVAAPSNVAGLHLRRRLAGGGDGFANVRFTPLSRVAELLGAPRLSQRGQRRLTTWGHHAAVAAALSEADGALGAVASHPGTIAAASKTLTELRHAPEGAVDVLDASPTLTAVATLYRRFCALTAGCYDDDDILDAAAAAVGDGDGAIADVGHLICFLPQPLFPSEVRFLRALAERDLAEVIVQPTGEDRPDEELSNLVSNLGDEAAAALVRQFAPAQPPELRVAVALDLEEEARLIVREIIRAAGAGTPLHRIGVLSGLPECRPLVREQLRAAGIESNGAAERPLARSATGRTLLALFSFSDRDMAREDVMRWLSQAPILQHASGDDRWKHVPAAQWERVARKASVVRGIEQWRKRLGAALSRDGSRHALADWEVPFGEQLLAFVNELHESIQPPRLHTAAALASHCEELLHRYLGPLTTVQSWETPAHIAQATTGHRMKHGEVEAYQRIVQLLREMQAGESPADPFAALSPTEAWQAFGTALEVLLSGPPPSGGRYGDGVFLGSLEGARGLSFNLLFIAGMTEGAMPSLAPEDPLLSDDERDGFGLPTRASRRVLERAAYRYALSAAPKVVLSCPRSSLRGQGKLGPSRWLLEAIERLLAVAPNATEHEPVSPEWLEEVLLRPPVEHPPWLIAPASFDASLTTTETAPASEQDYLLRSLRLTPKPPSRHFLARAEPNFRAGLVSATGRQPIWQRREPAVEPFDAFSGAVGGDQRLAPWLTDDDRATPVSPTSLEDYATCPYRYFLKHVLRIEETDEPEDRLTLDPAERGNIVHETLEAFLDEQRPTAGRRWSERDREMLRVLAAEQCREREDHGLTGAPISWESERQQILRDLEHFLDADEKARREHEASFVRAEARFGIGREWSAATFELPDGRTIRFHGQVDRVDASGGRYIVYDYKSGRSKDFKALDEDPVVRGKKLQLAVYSLAVRAAFELGPEAAVSAYYWFVSENERFQRRGFDVDESKLARFSEALQVIVGGIEGGLFPQVPGKTANRGPEHCGYCPYQRVCPRNVQAGWAERRGDARLARLVELIELDAVQAAESRVEAQ